MAKHTPTFRNSNIPLQPPDPPRESDVISGLVNTKYFDKDSNMYVYEIEYKHKIFGSQMVLNGVTESSPGWYPGYVGKYTPGDEVLISSNPNGIYQIINKVSNSPTTTSARVDVGESTIFELTSDTMTSEVGDSIHNITDTEITTNVGDRGTSIDSRGINIVNEKYTLNSLHDFKVQDANTKHDGTEKDLHALLVESGDTGAEPNMLQTDDGYELYVHLPRMFVTVPTHGEITVQVAPYAKVHDNAARALLPAYTSTVISADTQSSTAKGHLDIISKTKRVWPAPVVDRFIITSLIRDNSAYKIRIRIKEIPTPLGASLSDLDIHVKSSAGGIQVVDASTALTGFIDYAIPIGGYLNTFIGVVDKSAIYKSRNNLGFNKQYTALVGTDNIERDGNTTNAMLTREDNPDAATEHIKNYLAGNIVGKRVEGNIISNFNPPSGMVYVIRSQYKQDRKDQGNSDRLNCYVAGVRVHTR